MKKIIKLAIIAILAFAMLSIYNTSLAVTSGRVTLTPNKSSYEPGSEVVVSVDISDLTATTSFVEFGGIVKYNKDIMTLTAINSNLDGLGNPAKNVFTYGITTGSETVNKNVCNLVFKLNDTFEGTTDISLEIDLSGTQGRSTVSKSITVEKLSPIEPDPSEPGTTDPVNPDTPDNPDNPDNPDTPADPGTSETPENPDKQGTPDNPNNPGAHDTPENPGTTDAPNVPDDTENPDNQDDQSTPETPDKPENDNTQSQNKGDDEYKGTIPKTGENNTLIIVLASIFSIVIIALIIKRIIAKNNSLKK